VLHDEHCYTIQARILARGRLWMPRHELGDFFDSFHLITDRVYAAKYGPGAALFWAPAAALGLDLWLVPLVLTAATTALLYLVIARMIDGLAGPLAALMLLALRDVRRLSLETLSQIPMLFLILLAVWAFLNWRERKSAGRMALIGVAVGWGAITRPADAVCLALPLLVAILWNLRGATARRWLATLGVGLAATVPFLALQLVTNKGITGHWLELPWSFQAARSDPYDTPSIAPFDPARRSQSAVPQVRIFEEEVTVPLYKEKLASGAMTRNWRVSRATADASLPNPLLLLLAPMAIPALGGRGRWVLVAALCAFVAFYARYTFFQSYYAMTVAPALILLALLGWRELARSLPARGGAAVTMIGGLAIAATAVASLPQLRPGAAAADEWDIAPLVRLVNARLDDLPRKPAVVLFQYTKVGMNYHFEPVYNIDVAWPDDAPIIRAHDLGPARNRELFAYYARVSPDRAIYLYDRGKDLPDVNPLTYLGTARELAASPGNPP
jgi:hypothetical protein